jgi:hypothetical protein
MKCISLWQPWATLISVGAKRIETRGRRTSVRGLIAIHAAKKWTAELRAICRREPFKTVLPPGFSYGPPLGKIMVVARLIECVEIRYSKQFKIGWTSSVPPIEPELSFGDYTPGRFAWMLTDIVKLPVPLPWRGAQGWFDVPDDILEQSCKEVG